MKPTFIVVGAAKAGTSSLWTYLNDHPHVFMTRPKEPNYYVDGFGIASESEYESLFDGAHSNQQRGEASTSYLYVPRAAERISAELGPDTRIVIMLRDPIRMAHSLWAYNTSTGREWLPFSEALAEEERRLSGGCGRVNRTLPNPTVLAYVGRGMYADQVGRFMDRFEDVHVSFFEEFFADVEPSYDELCRYLGVSSHRPDFGPVNRGGVPRSRTGRALLAGTSPNRKHWWSTAIRKTVPNAWRANAREWHSNLRLRLTTIAPPIEHSSVETIRAAASGDVRKLETLLERSVPAAWSDYNEL